MASSWAHARALALAAVIVSGLAGSPVAPPDGARAGQAAAAGDVSLMPGGLPGVSPSIADPDVPDPVTFLPMAPAAGRANRPEAVIGFGSRGEQPTAAVPGPTSATPESTPDPAKRAPEPVATGPTGATTPQGGHEAPDGPAAGAAGSIPAPGATSATEVQAAGTGNIHGRVRASEGGYVTAGVTATGLVTPPTSAYASGYYVLDLPPDEYILHFTPYDQVHAGGYWCSGPHLCVEAAAATRVTVTDGGSVELDVTVDLKPVISGTVLNADGSPAARAGLYVDGRTGNYTSTQHDGSFSIPVAPGSHTLYVGPAGALSGGFLPGGFYSAASPNHWTQLPADATAIEVAIGSDATGIDITLPPYRNLSGIFTSLQGDPITTGLYLWAGNDRQDLAMPDGGGAFSFRVPSGSSYTLQFAGYCPFAGAWHSTAAPGYALSQASSSVISVGNEDTTGVHMQAPPCGRLQGTVTLASGGPVAVGGVHAAYQGVDPTGNHWSSYGSIASDGTFSLGVQPGTYHLEVWDSGGSGISGYYTPGGWVATEAEAAPITVGLAGASGLDIELPSFRYVTGRLLDPDGLPVSGVQVQPSWVYPSRTGADGRFSLKLAIGSYKVSLGSTNRTRAGYRGAAGWVASVDDAAPVATLNGSVDLGDITVPFLPRVRGTVTGSTGAPLAGVRVGLWAQSQPSYYSPIIDTTTAPDGTYTLFVPEGWIGGAMAVRAGQDKVYEEKSTDVAGSGDHDGMDFTLRGFPSVIGTVTDSSGTPLQSISVAVWEGSTWHGTMTDVAGRFRYAFPIGPTVTDVHVQFSDQYSAYVGGYYGEGGFSRTTPVSFSVAVDQVVTADIVMPTYRRVSGTVRAAGGAPVSGVGLFACGNPPCWSSGSGSTTWTDSLGRFSLKVAPGSSYVAVASPGGQPSGYLGDEGFNATAEAAGPFTIPDHDLARDITLPAAVYLSGHVSTPSKLIDSLEVDILLNGAAYAKTWTTKDGDWSIAVAPGAYIVGIYDPSKAYSHGWVGVSGFTLDPGQARVIGVSTKDVTGINVALKRNVTLKGSVKDTAGRPHAYVYTEVWINGRYYDQTWTSSAGAYSLRVPAGSTAKVWMYDANLKLAPGWRTSKTVTANPALAAATRIGTSSVSGINLVAPAPRFIRGTVSAVNWSGSTVYLKKAYVGAIAYGSAASLAIAGTGGKFKIPVLPGTYRVWSDVIGLVAGRPAAYAGGWYRPGGITARPDLATKITPPAGGSTLAVKLAKPAGIGGTILSTAGTWINGVAVVFVNGYVYDSVATANSRFAITVPPGTYRVGFYDPFGIYREGWYQDGTGYTDDFAAASDVVVTTSQGANLVPALPLDSPPAAPTGVTAVPYHASAAVSWTNPPTTPSRPILHATVTAHPGGRQCTSPDTSCTVTGLTDGTAYTFRVTVSTNTGPGSASVATAPVAPVAVPEAPTLLGVVQGGLSPTVTWTAPADNGSPITGYTLTASPGGATCTAAADATSCQFDALAEGFYAFDVVATNANGNGPAAMTSSTAVDITPPAVGAPVIDFRTGLAMTASAVPVTVRWAATDAVAGVAGTSLERSVNGGTFSPVMLASATATSWTGTLPANGSSFTYRAGATDAVGLVTGPVEAAPVRIALTQEKGTGTSVGGTWTLRSRYGASGGKTRSTTQAGASFTFKFTGRAVAWVTERGWSAGTTRVYLDGVLVAKLTPRANWVPAWVVWSRTFPTSGSHTLKLVNVTAGKATDVDAFVVLK